MIGTRFHRLVVVSELPKVFYNSKSYRKYLCLCDCGKTIEAFPSNLKRGSTKSCGCWKKENSYCKLKTHGMSKTPEFRNWISIRRRCYEPSHKDFHLWGGKGITVCDAWINDFKQFYDDMGQRPTPNHTVDRIDSSKGYNPSNCRWATPIEQSANTARTIIVTYHGKEISLRQFALAINRSYFTIYDWYKRRGKTVEQILRLVASQNS